jgi:hypothetical protein
MELIEVYKGVKIFRSSRTTFYKIGCAYGGGDFSSLEFARKLIDISQRD